MTVTDILHLLPENLFDELAVETNVDHQVKKLTGETVFKLILFSMLGSEKLSLRIMEGYLSSAKFQSFANTEFLDSRYNSIRDRICTINAQYFEKLFSSIFSIYNKELKEENALSKTDSTYVALATKLFSQGMKNGSKQERRYLKYSVNLKGSIPSSAKAFIDQSYVSEEMALSEIINETDCLVGNTVVFDRGLQSRSSFEKFSNEGKYFISRTSPNIRYKDAFSNLLVPKPAESSVTITTDETAWLINKHGKQTTNQYRIIKGKIDATGESIGFVTNMLDIDQYTIANWYKQRWEIEVFFKFLKQHLNTKHLISRTENGIKVMLYMTMILATLIIVYKKLNRIKGYKIAKLKFEIELDNDIIRNIVILCGGDPGLAPHLFNKT